MKQFLKLMLGFAALVMPTLLGLSPNVANAQTPNKIKVTPVDNINIRPSPIIDALKVKPGGLDLNSAKKVATGLLITRLDAVRGSPGIDITGVIENVSFQPLTGVSYSLSKLTESGWKKIKTGTNITIAAKKTLYVFAGDTATNALVGYKLEATSPGQKDSKDFTLAERKLTYIVKYETKSNWVLARYFPDQPAPPGKLAGEGARKLKESLQAMGFETRTTTKRTEHPFSDWEFEFWVYVRTATPLQRTFDNWRSAVEFRDSVRALVPDQGLTLQILEK